MTSWPRSMPTLLCLLAISLLTASVSCWADDALDPDIHPLAPPDRSSPGMTISSFMTHMNRAHAAYLRQDDTDAGAHEFRRAVHCLDLRDVAPTLHFDVGGYSSLLLKEVLDRVELPQAEQFPAADEKLEYWTIPGTEIVLERVQEGELAGQYLFSARTLERLPEFYERARALPYQPGATPNLLDTYLDNPGGMVPFRWAEYLPAWAATRVFDRPVWKWLALFAFFAFGFVLVLAVHWLGGQWDHRFARRRPYLRFGSFWVAFSLVLLAWALDVYVDDVIGMRGELESLIKRGALVLAFTSAVFCIFAMFELISALVVSSARSPSSGVNAHLVRFVFRIISIGVIVYVVVVASEYLGWAVAPVVAGLGVGGLALALAARPTIENVIGGLTLFADRPFRVGDRCRFGEDVGDVEEIGLRSTRVRTLERSLLSMPNADLAVMKIENLGRRDMRLLRTTLGLRYETTADQLRWVLATVREMLLAHPMVSPDSMRTRFIGYGAYSLDIEVFAYLKCETHDTFLALSEDLLLRIMEIVRESGTTFAFPSQVNYFARDHGLDSTQQAEKEAEVEQWRQRGKFPFPNFSEESRAMLEDTLDYPPSGSPEFTPRK